MAVAPSTSGRIGPNAIIQSVAALAERHGDPVARSVLARGGFERLLFQLPDAMVPERDFHDLAQALAAELGAEEAGAVLERAGELTAGYLLRARIPRPAQWLLRALPARAALAALLPAVARNAWTFGESGSFGYALGAAPEIRVANPALCDTPAAAALACRFYRGTFGALLRALVSPRAALRERACQGQGDAQCVYELRVTSDA